MLQHSSRDMSSIINDHWVFPKRTDLKIQLLFIREWSCDLIWVVLCSNSHCQLLTLDWARSSTTVVWVIESKCILDVWFDPFYPCR